MQYALRPNVALLTVLGAAALVACGTNAPSAGAADAAVGEPGEELLGGATTTFETGPAAFSLPARNLSDGARSAFALGDHLFNRNWITAPASTPGGDGLGPTFNATSCSACHLHDGRGAPPEKEGEDFLGLLVRLSVPGEGDHGEPKDEPSYGGQFNPFAILGVPAEGKATVTYEEAPGTYADGEAYSLRKPTYHFTDLAFGPMATDTLTSPRVAPATHGLGLLELIPEADVLALADEKDANGDGISGRPNWVWNARAGQKTLGRLGWKANQPTLEQQTAGAFLGDIGITTSMNTAENCPSAQAKCVAAPTGGLPELDDEKLAFIVDYGMTLGVPARRDWNGADVRRGEAVFAHAKCGSCHAPKAKTGPSEKYPALANQAIRPYTDLLLHDMGAGLGDGRPDFAATGNEWRTAPLWGVGLIETVSRHSYLLHDGRARGLAEAILWHGGEAAASKNAFVSMPKSDREALLAFLKSL